MFNSSNCTMAWIRRLSVTGLAAAALGVALSAGSAKADEASCAGLRGQTVPPQAIAMASGEAAVTAADYTTAAAGMAFCKVTGSIKPVDPSAPPILFEVNLPQTWNNKVVQYGGGGLNGTLVTGLAGLRDAPPGPTPLERGYVTFGTDAGHPNTPPVHAFALNDEALLNHAYGAYKKTHDVALALVQRYYGRRPSRMYFFGGSEGGREAMSAVQRYPKDYDGAVSVVPVMSWAGIQLATYNHWILQQNGGWLSPAKQALLSKATLEACDGLDGLKDGVISRYRGCREAFRLSSLRCPGGAEAGDGCLTDPQIALIDALHRPYRYPYKLANGEDHFPPFSIGGELQPGGLTPLIVDQAAPKPTDRGENHYQTGDVRYFITRDPAFTGPLDERKYAARIQQISQMMDMTDPDLGAFRARGGKLIMKENTADYQQAPETGFEYYDRVVARMGAPAVSQFLRLYVAPGVNHNGAGVAGDGSPIPDRVDLLSELDRWVEQGKPPGPLTLTSFDRAQPTVAVASRPLCEYPRYPRYKGAGDPKQAASYSCER